MTDKRDSNKNPSLNVSDRLMNSKTFLCLAGIAVILSVSFIFLKTLPNSFIKETTGKRMTQEQHDEFEVWFYQNKRERADLRARSEATSRELAVTLDKLGELEVSSALARKNANGDTSYTEVLNYKNEVLAMPSSSEKSVFLDRLKVIMSDEVMTNNEFIAIKKLYIETKDASSKQQLIGF